MEAKEASGGQERPEKNSLGVVILLVGIKGLLAQGF
jgi:hypothetical protein